MAYDPACVDQTSLNIQLVEERIAGKDCFYRVAGGEHIEDVLNCDAATANDWLSPENQRIDRNAPKQFRFSSHSAILPQVTRITQTKTA